MNIKNGPIGIFDSGFGGLTVMREIVKQLPSYDFIYLGDNARTPYGNRSFETVYQFTWQCVSYLFEQQCPLVIVACNTASAKALRTIQQKDLVAMHSSRRVLGVIRPTTEMIGRVTKTGKVGILGTQGTVNSQSYVVEIAKFFPEVKVYQQACPMWVPLVENNELDNPGTEYFVRHYLALLLEQCAEIDTVALGCTHYPLLEKMIRKFLPAGVTLVSQGEIVAGSLVSYLGRHPDIQAVCTQQGKREFLTTDAVIHFNEKGGLFYGEEISARHVSCG